MQRGVTRTDSSARRAYICWVYRGIPRYTSALYDIYLNYTKRYTVPPHLPSARGALVAVDKLMHFIVSPHARSERTRTVCRLILRVGKLAAVAQRQL